MLSRIDRKTISRYFIYVKQKRKMISIYTWDQRRSLLMMVLTPVTSPPPRIPSSRYIFLNFATTLKYHTFPCLFLFLSSVYLFLPVSRKPNSASDPDGKGSDLYTSLSFSTSLDCSRRIAGAQSVGKRRPIENPVPTFSFEWKKKKNTKERRNKTKREERLSEYSTEEEGN